MRAFVVCITALGLASTASAQAMKPMPGMSAAAVKTGKGVGVVTALDPKAGKVTIKHGPIPALDWPGMTMTFRAAPALLRPTRIGQTVAFDVRMRGTTAEVSAMTRR